MNFKAAALAIVKARSNGTQSHVAARLGFRYLDSGCYGAAYLHTATQKVLKVSFTRKDGTMGFIARCAEHFRKHGEAPLHCVRVYEYGMQRDFWYAVMERVRVGEFLLHDYANNYDFLKAVHRDICRWIGMDNLTDKFRFGGLATDADTLPSDLGSRNCGISMDGTRMCVFDPWAAGVHVRKFPKTVVHPRTYGPQRHQGARYAV